MSMKLAFLLPALFLAFPHGHAGAAPFEPSVLEALQPPAEHGAFHSGWISLGLKAADLEEKQVSPGHITDVGEAQMQLYFPAGWKPQDRRAALCIFPGGGYAIQAIEKEGGHIARWAAEHGMVGVVVKYRVSGSNDAVGRFPGPLLDARQALRVTRRHASALGVDPHRIGVMGFSAGGHLAAMASTLWNRPLPEEAENPLKSVSARPDFSLLIYPVITMDPKTTHAILELIRKINKELGITVVIITHQMSVVEEVCNRVAILDNGTVVEEGEVQAIFSHPSSAAAKRLVYPAGAPKAENLPGHKLVRVAFGGTQTTDKPLVASLAIECGALVSIMGADTRIVNGQTLGSMLLALPEDEHAEAALEYIKNYPGITYEEVNN